MVKPEMQEVHLSTLPEHWAQLELQGWQEPWMAVKPEPQLVTHWPLEMIPDAHWQAPLTGTAPVGQLVWQAPWKK
jgi:hypothetical protein